MTRVLEPIDLRTGFGDPPDVAAIDREVRGPDAGRADRARRAPGASRCWADGRAAAPPRVAAAHAVAQRAARAAAARSLPAHGRGHREVRRDADDRLRARGRAPPAGAGARRRARHPDLGRAGPAHRRAGRRPRRARDERPRTIAILCRNHRGFVEALVASAKLGADALLLNTGFSGPQLTDVLVRESADLIVYDEEFAAIVEAARAANPRLATLLAWTDEPGRRRHRRRPDRPARRGAAAAGHRVRAGSCCSPRVPPARRRGRAGRGVGSRRWRRCSTASPGARARRRWSRRRCSTRGGSGSW